MVLLQVLELDNNKLKEIDKEIFSLRNLRELTLFNNEVRTQGALQFIYCCVAAQRGALSNWKAYFTTKADPGAE